MGTQKTVINSILSALYLVANVAILAFAALLFFGLIWSFPITIPIVAVVCAALMIAMTLWFALKSGALGFATLAALVYNDLAAIAATVLIFLFNGDEFPFPILFAIPVITFFLCAAFLIYDLLQTKAAPQVEEYLPDYMDEDFIFRPVPEEDAPTPVEQPVPAPVETASPVEIRTVSFDDFADYIEEE